MKNVSISLTDQHAAAIEAELASGDYASVSEVVRAALREFLDRPTGPDLKQIDADIARYRAGATLTGADAARRRIRAAIAE
ncbi:type II toxin-antitoxin system ParD family antitoxin [Acuticoccus sediminis]|uniref:Type II toxin-antitoxin system ParD family antitoxin n=1 Tax=Acuticoccus sediminis TaxID=2184697 RepID=A0A8B2NDS4_9HYPH|nr:type II toxin-antitoxin system ParD family antitoxin [Acuticoccus sediminis]RAH96729.1 type II toxin-antitoxin system ParD family antitoxin [Acuticoccus sediminis]